jgi:hypothetical protein
VPGPTVNGFSLPRLVPVAPEPVYQVSIALVPLIPLAVTVVVFPVQIGLASTVTELMDTSVFNVTSTLAQKEDVQGSVSQRA